MKPDQIPEDVMQAALSAGDLPGTPSEVRAIELAYRAGRSQVIGALCVAVAEVFKESGLPMSFRVQLSKILDVPGSDT